MGKVTNIAFAIMVGFFLTGLLGAAVYNGSNDVNKTQFQNYSQSNNLSQLNEQNLSYANTGDSVSNMQLAAEAIAVKIAEAQRSLKSGNPVDQVLGAFGMVSALTLDVVGLLLAILLDGMNFIAGIAGNVSSLPTPWNMFGILIGFGMGLFIVYAVFRIADIVVKGDM